MLELNYIDTGFGSKLIDFTQSPFDNIDNQNTIEFGFGSKDFDVEGIIQATATLNNNEASIISTYSPSTALENYTVSFSHTGVQYKSTDNLIKFENGTTTLNEDNFTRVDGMENAFPPITATVSYLSYTAFAFLEIEFILAGVEGSTTVSYLVREDNSVDSFYFLNSILIDLEFPPLQNNLRLSITTLDAISEDGKVFSITSNYADNDNVVANYTNKDNITFVSDPFTVPVNGEVNLNDLTYNNGGNALFDADPLIRIDFNSDGDIGTDTSMLTTLVVELNNLVNTKSLSFGSKDIKLNKKEVKYEYEDIFERGSISIDKNSFGTITIKNRMITNPTISCTTFISGLAADISINIERISTRKFKVFNPSNKKIEVYYIASFDNIKKTSITHNQVEIDIKNQNIREYLIS